MLPINWLANFKRGGISFELRDNERVEEEGRKARKFVEKLSWDNLTDEFEKVLEGVICGGYVLSGAFNAICNKQFLNYSGI
jgi:glycosyltransferase involved in cell wall biosynthesis